MARTKVKHQAARVLIVDDHPAVREALCMRIAAHADLEVCGEAAGAGEALRLVVEQKPDITIIDISLNDGDGIDLIKRIKSRNAAARILVWSMHGETLYGERALNAGALGYVTKDRATDQIILAIRQVLAGRVFLSPELNERLVRRSVGMAEPNPSESPVDALSDRELEIFRLISQATKVRAIANHLHLSVKTVETHRDRIRKKLELRDANELVCYAVKWAVETH